MLRRPVVVLAVLVAAWLVVCGVLFVWPPAETGAPAHADAIVMLSGDIARLKPAEQLARRGTAPILAISRVPGTQPGLAAKGLCAAGSYAGVKVLCFTARPYSTRGEAETFSRIARARGWRSAVVVSSTYHLTRAKLLFDRCFDGRLAFVGVPDVWWRLPYDWTSETGKLLVQLVAERSC